MVAQRGVVRRLIQLAAFVRSGSDDVRLLGQRAGRSPALRGCQEIAGQYLKKGSQVYIEGRIRTRKWQDKDGQERYTTEIEAEEMKMLGSRQGQGEPSYGGDAPAPSYGGAKPAAAAKKPSFDDMDDDIPF